MRRCWNGMCALALGAVLASAVSCSQGQERPSVLLILLDTLRADKLGCYGSELGLTPNLDRFANDALLFENASSHAPWTLPSTASILTSLHPVEHGAGGSLRQFTKLDPEVETLPGLYKRAGYDTAVVLNVSFLGREFGLTRGFDHVDATRANNRESRAAEQTTDAALSWLKRGDRPFFLMVHYFDPHLTYDPPQPFRRRFAAPEDRGMGSFSFGSRRDVVTMRVAGTAPSEIQLRRAEQLYHGEIAYLDSEVGRLLEAIDDLGLRGETVVVITSDHGEEFLDHENFEHGHTLYRELAHVPLMLRAPGVNAPIRVPQLVRHVDLAPTLCALTDVEPSAQFAGQSLLDLVGNESKADRPVLAHGNFWGEPLTSWTTGEFKLILRTVAGAAKSELYRWKEDRSEQRDLAASEPEAVEQMKRSLERFQAAMADPSAQRSDAVELSEQIREQLEYLGYAEPDEKE